MADERESFGIGEAEERALVRRSADGDESARAKLLAAYEPLIRSIAKRYARKGGPPWKDLLQEGRGGLVRALRDYDPTKGAPFVSYARPFVKAAIESALRPADGELAGLDAEALAVEPAVGEAPEEEPTSGRRTKRARQLGDFVGGRRSGRDAYVEHPAAADADVRVLLEAWLLENRGWSLEERAWGYLRDAEPDLFARARDKETQTSALAALEQKYSILRTRFELEERSHQAKELRIGPDSRSETLARLVAHAVEAGTLGERSWRAKLAEQGIAPLTAPGFGEVLDFRERFLGGELIAQDQVVAWVERQADREGPPAPAYARVPLAENDLAAFGELALAGSAEAFAAWLEGTARRIRQGHDPELPQTSASPPLALSYGLPGDRAQIVRIRADGALTQLKLVVTNLLAHFDGWLEEEAVAFVLAGVVPPLDKLRAKTRPGLYRAASRITLDCDPRTAPADVAAFYERLRRRWLKGRDRSLKDKNLAMAGFAEEQWRPGASWDELRERWNERYPDGHALHYRQPLNQFATECRYAWERVTGELWPSGKRAERKLKEDVAAARKARRRRVAEAANS